MQPFSVIGVPNGWLALQRCFDLRTLFSADAIFHEFEPVEMTTAFDEWVPLNPPWVVVYAMIYPTEILPLFVVKDPLVFRRVMVAYTALELVAMGVFLLCPVHMTIRPPLVSIAGHDFFSWGLRVVYWADHPTCCFPSLHVATATLAALSCWRVNRRTGIGVGIVALLISASTMLIKQHFVYDVVVGGGLAFASYWIWVRTATPLNSNALALRFRWLCVPISFFLALMTAFVILFMQDWQPWLDGGR